MFNRIIEKLAGDHNQKQIDAIMPIVAQHKYRQRLMNLRPDWLLGRHWMTCFQRLLLPSSKPVRDLY